MFNYYEEQPGSPLVEWIRYANRRAKDFQELPKRVRDGALSTVVLFVLAWMIVGPDEALEQLVALAVAAIASVFVLPAAKWFGHFMRAFHVLLKEENQRLHDDNEALSETLASVRQQHQDLLKAHLHEPLSVQVPAEVLAVRGLPLEVRISRVEPFIGDVRREGAKRLAHFREYAITQLGNRMLTHEAELSTLQRDIELWERQVIEVLEQYSSIEELTTFRVLGTYTTRVTGGVNAEHNREIAMLWERIKRLESVIKRLSSE